MGGFGGFGGRAGFLVFCGCVAVLGLNLGFGCLVA